MRLKLGAFLGDRPPLGQAEHLESAAVGQHRTFPADKAMEAATASDELVTGAEEQVIGVAENDLRAALDQVAVKCGLDRALRAHGHERRRVHETMRRLELAQPRRAVGGAQCEAKRPALSLVEGASQPVYY